MTYSQRTALIELMLEAVDIADGDLGDATTWIALRGEDTYPPDAIDAALNALGEGCDDWFAYEDVR